MKQVLFKNKNVTVNVEEYESYVYLDSVVVDERYRNKGLGTAILIEIISYAEGVKKPLLVYASNELGGNLERLMEWYKRYGFYEEWNVIKAEYNYNLRKDF